MSYSFTGRIRYSEVGEDRRLTLPALINYFQDCTIFQSEDAGIGVDKLARCHQAWLLSAWQIVINRMPQIAEPIRTATWAYNFKLCNGHRNFTLTGEDGEMLAYANSLWIFFDLAAGRPVTVPPEEIAGYPVEERLDIEYAPRKIRLPEHFERLDDFQIQTHHIDTNHHVNNGQYIQMAMNYLPQDFRIHQMRAEYKSQAHLGDTVIPMVHLEPNRCIVELNNKEGSPYAVVELKND